MQGLSHGDGAGRQFLRGFVAAINGGRVAPLFPGDTVFAWSQVLDREDLPRGDFPRMRGGNYDPAVILDLDYWVLMPR